MQRRIFLTLIGASATSPAHEWLIAATGGDTSRSTGTQLPVEIVDHLDAITDRLRRMDDQLGGTQTLNLVRQHLATVVDLLESRRFDDSVGRRLHTTAAELLRLAGWLCFDDSAHPQAQRFWIAALHEAHTAGDRALGANILGFMSCQAKDLGQIRAAVTLAETARAGYPAASRRVSTILDLRAAEAYANERDTGSCRAAIDAAFEHLTKPSPQHGDPAWCYWVTEAQAHAQAGYCYVKLEDWPRARQHLRHAIRLQGNEFSREGALRNALLATTYVQQEHPDLDKALHLGRQAVTTLSDQVTSARCVKHVHRLVASLHPYRRDPSVRHFTDIARPLLRAYATT
jgi:tetratricopeptide (TPR) repeat protein